mgnify:CR=1 FL=1
MNLSDLRRLLANTNVTAFLRVIRERESSQDESAYTVLNGGARFFSFAAHPYKGQRTPPGKAAGAYQFIASTWGDVEQQYGMPDFSPASQDAGAVARLVYRGALEDVMAGRFEQAVTKCRLEWTSLPGAAESSGSWTMDKALAVFRKWGGRTAAELAALRPGGAPTTTPQPPAKAGQPNQREGARTMGALAILQMFGPALAALIPQIANIVKPESEVAKRNVALAETIVNTVVENAGATNMQDAVEKMQSDPALTEAVKKAVVTEPAVMGALQIVEVGGGAKAAAERDVVVQQQEKPFWKTSAVFWVSILLLPMIYWYIGSSVAGGIEIPPDWPWYAQLPLRLLGTAWDAGARVGLANLVIGLVLGGICGVYYGISVTQAKQQGGPANQKEA